MKMKMPVPLGLAFIPILFLAATHKKSLDVPADLKDAPNDVSTELNLDGAANLVGQARQQLRAAASAPKAGSLARVETDGGFEFWDETGLAFSTTKSGATTYNRELQQTQRRMNQNRPPEVAFVPETGRVNPEMFEYVLRQMTDRHAALAKGAHPHAEYLAKAKDAIGSYRKDVDALKALGSPLINDGQAATLQLGEQTAWRYLTLAELESQMNIVKDLGAQQAPPAEKDLTAEQRALYKQRASGISSRLPAMRDSLQKAREALLSSNGGVGLNNAMGTTISIRQELTPVK